MMTVKVKVMVTHLQRACHSEGVRARSRQFEQTLEAVARSVGDRRERMERLTGAGSRDRGSEQPMGHRWCKPECHKRSTKKYRQLFNIFFSIFVDIQTI